MAPTTSLQQRKPEYHLPAGACDTHCHIWGPLERYPFAAQRTYTPPECDKYVLRAMHQRLGISRVVVVQPIVHGTDNRVTLDAIADDPANYRGIALVDADVSDAELLTLHEGGVRGIRFGFVKHLKARPDMGEFRRMVDRIAPLGWHVLIHLDAADIEELRELLCGLPVPVVIDHMGRIDAAGGIEQPAFKQLLALATQSNCWVKLSGADRVSATGGSFMDVVPFAQALMRVTPERVLWGTDFPHPNPRHAISDDADLVNLLPHFGDPLALRKLLVSNPARLYDFSDPGQ